LTEPSARNYISNLNLGMVDNELKYFLVTARSMGKPWDKYSLKKPIYDEWEALIQESFPNQLFKPF
jgi:hypothetical protein